jgi:hypothetical protein
MPALSDTETQSGRRRRVASALALCCVLAGLPATATARAAAGAARPSGSSKPKCGRIAFAKQSDEVAFNISVSAAGCAVAHDVASASVPTWPSTLAERTYQARGFACVGRLVLPNGKAYEHYVCLRRSAKIIFDRG